MQFDPTEFKESFATSAGDVQFFSLPGLANREGGDLSRLPYSEIEARGLAELNRGHPVKMLTGFNASKHRLLESDL